MHSYGRDSGIESADMPTSSRRDLLKTLALAGVGSALRGQAAGGRIDVHHHFTPPFYVKAMEKELAGSGFTARPWSPALSLEAMDKNGVAAALLSPVQRLVMDSMSDRSERARTLTRQSNEFGAQVVHDNPRRSGLLAALPLPDTEGSLREIAYAYDTLKTDGIALWTSYLDKWRGEVVLRSRVGKNSTAAKPSYSSIPRRLGCCRNLIPGLSISGIIEYDLDTARAAESMLVNRTPMRFPQHPFHLFALPAEPLPVLAARIVDDLPRDNKALTAQQVTDAFKMFYYETAHSKPAALGTLKDVAPVSQILFSSDVPIRAYDLTTTGLDEYQGFSPSDWRAINRGNAEHLWPRFKT